MSALRGSSAERDDWSGRRVTVMGLGLFGGGVAAARFLARHGAEVTVTDLRDATTLARSVEALEGLPLRLVLGSHDEADFTTADVVVANPAVPPTAPLLEAARGAGARITSELELSLERLEVAPLLVTGTHGKSSTVHFTVQLLEGAGVPALAAGNLGLPLLDRLDEVGGRLPVIEVSSYQLEALERPLQLARGAAITPVVSDHLERHGTLAAYRAVKQSIARHVAPGGFLLAEPAMLADMPAGSSKTRNISKTRTIAAPGSQAAGLDWTASGDGLTLDGQLLLSLAGLELAPGFPRENAARAAALACLSGAEPGRVEALLPHLEGLPHRLEELGLRGGRRIIDNGVSTTPESTVAAIESLAGQGSLPAGSTLLAGGKAKEELDHDGLARTARDHDLFVVCFGASARLLAGSCAGAGARHVVEEAFDAAVELALGETARGATLLLSPACASFDAFPNFRARAEAFRSILPPQDSGPAHGDRA